MDLDIADLVRKVAAEADEHELSREPLQTNIESIIQQETSRLNDALVSVFKRDSDTYTFLITVHREDTAPEHYAGYLDTSTATYEVTIEESYTE